MTPENERIKLLAVKGVSSDTLSQFVYTQELDLKGLFEDMGYSIFFNILRRLPLSRQEELLVDFFTQKVENFPNGEKLAKFLAKVNNIPWFESQEEPDQASLQQLSNKYCERLNIKPLPIEVVRDVMEATWLAMAVSGVTPSEGVVWSGVVRNAEKDKAERIAFDVARFSGRFDAEKAASWAAWGLHNQADHASWDVVCAAQWITVEDLMPQYGYDKGNPFEVLFEGIYDKGYWFIGPYSYMGKSFIFAPEIKK